MSITEPYRALIGLLVLLLRKFSSYNKMIVEYLECFPMLRAYETNRKREKKSFHVKTQGNGIQSCTLSKMNISRKKRKKHVRSLHNHNCELSKTTIWKTCGVFKLNSRIVKLNLATELVSAMFSVGCITSKFEVCIGKMVCIVFTS